ncbi:hypothetical protein GCM10008995_26710 [Halobellus salinus]|uniref:FAD:protein FMN transferase n=1 Tax=Halobellus salinus TaxID=931585 RepID=A0A830EVV0_9EURY|nr:hypothetical protein GCM10008995_26710 [Halobellus salinus]SMP32958.1 thiamine biosynthesis lipoprotein [Halobellus salinus]
MIGDTLEATYERLGHSRREFKCCDTTWEIEVVGLRSRSAVSAACRTAHALEAQLNAFDEASAVSRLNDEGAVTNEHIARIVRRGLAYYELTDRVFDIHQGRVEHDLKGFLRKERDTPPASFDTGAVTIEANTVYTDVPLDLNGLAKGYIVDRVFETVNRVGRRGFVSGGGDLSPPTGPVGVESPYGDDTPLKILDTDWYVATSGGYRRERDGTDHIYDPTTNRLGSRHESVTVVAERDCMAADAFATTLAALSLTDAQSLADRCPGIEALIVHNGVFHPTAGFSTHVLDT